jgi:hypothetical protein
MWIALVLAACKNDPEGSPTEPRVNPPAEPTPFAPAPATLVRLTDAEWRNSVEDLFGVRYTGALPLDFRLLNYGRVGGSQLTIPPADLDLYESAAWTVATNATPDDDAVERALGVSPTDHVAVRARLAPVVARAWRRPPTTTELDELMDRWTTVEPDLGADIAMRATIAAILLSPDFQFHAELGVPDPDHAGWRRLTGWERAGRLASFLTATVPDEELARAAAAGELDTDVDALVAQATRLLGTRRARETLAGFFAETLDLHELDSVTKDEELYPEFTATLRAEMRAELEDLFTDVALDRGADLGELLTTERTTAGPELSALYGIAGDATTLPGGDARGGLLGRAGFLTVQSHNTLTSPTNRGRFVRTRLFCQPVPPPPPGVSTELDPVADGTLRDRLEQHAVDPSCAPCHSLMDPMGYALEHFDPIGRRRELDAGLPIDATGSVGGVQFDGAAELGAAVADQDAFSRCVATNVYRYATAQVDRAEDEVVVDAIDLDFVDAGRAFSPLLEAIVRSEGFLTVGAPAGEDCATEGETRSCANDCGAGTEACLDGTWMGCTAPAPAPEACNDRDDDCDGDTDEDLERTCTDTFGPGTETCEAGDWTECVGSGPPPETCNGVDDDADGDIDEDLAVHLEPFTDASFQAEGHPACDVRADAWSPACHAAAHRGCAARGCAVTGFGPVELGATDLSVTCLDDTQALPTATTFSELSTHHDGCNAGYRQGGACNAAISRFCASRGQGTGYGPVENSGDDATVVCVPTATVLESSYSALSGLDAGCNQGTRWGAACDRAIHDWCGQEGYRSGFGPLENNGDLAIVACVGVP